MFEITGLNKDTLLPEDCIAMSWQEAQAVARDMWDTCYGVVITHIRWN